MSDRRVLILVLTTLCATARADDRTAPLTNAELTPAEERIWKEREAEWAARGAGPTGLDLSDAAIAAYAKMCKSRLTAETTAQATRVRIESGDKKTAWDWALRRARTRRRARDRSRRWR